MDAREVHEAAINAGTDDLYGPAEHTSADGRLEDKACVEGVIRAYLVRLNQHGYKVTHREATVGMLVETLPVAMNEKVPALADKRLAAEACERLGATTAGGILSGCDVLRDWRAMHDAHPPFPPEDGG